jgi:hypothetical protein
MSSKTDSPSPSQQRPGPALGETIADLWSQHSWLGIGLLWALALWLAYVGFLRHAALTGHRIPRSTWST